MDCGDVELGGRIAAAFVWYWMHSKQLIEATERIRTAIDALPDDEPIAARLWYALAYVFNDLFHYDRGRQAGQHALEVAERTGDAECTAHALVALASAAFVDTSFDGETAFKRAIEIFTTLGNRRMLGITLGRRARTLGVQGHIDEARSIYEQALSISRSLGDDRTTAQILNNLAEADFHKGNVEQALRLASESIEHGIAARMEGNLVSTYGNMCMYYLACGKVDEALTSARRGLDVARNVQNWSAIRFFSLHFAAIATEHGDFERAATCLGRFMPAMQEQYGTARIEETEQVAYDRVMQKLRERLDAARLEQLLVRASSISQDELLEQMLAVS
jgi:tetratricopeptide (TPR) repeat protein